MHKRNIFCKKIFFVLLGSLITALSINIFMVPHEFLSSGIGGIALIIQYLFKIPSGISIVVLNIPLIILSIKYIDKEFTILTIAGIISTSIFLILTKNIWHLFYLKDVLLSSVYGGIIQGIGVGLVFDYHGSLGGTDILSMLAKKKYNFEISEFSFLFNFILLIIASYLFGIERGLYSIASIYACSKFMDKLIKGFGRKKLLFVITDKDDIIKSSLKNELGRNCTILYGYSPDVNKERKIIYCVLFLRQVPKAKNLIKSIDTYAFTSILDTSEVEGREFKEI